MFQARPASRPGSTDQTSGTESSTPAPAARSISTVIRRCGALGTGGPTWRTTTPRSNSGAASSSPETSWLEADASMVTVAAAHPAGAVHGQRQPAVGPASSRTPRSLSALEQRRQRPLARAAGRRRT